MGVAIAGLKLAVEGASVAPAWSLPRLDYTSGDSACIAFTPARGNCIGLPLSGRLPHR